MNSVGVAGRGLHDPGIRCALRARNRGAALRVYQVWRSTEATAVRTFSGLKKLRPLLTAEATADARGRAQAALGGTGRLGKLISNSVGQVSVDAPGSVNIGSGDFYTGSIQQVVSVAVSATYSIPS